MRSPNKDGKSRHGLRNLGCVLIFAISASASAHAEVNVRGSNKQNVSVNGNINNKATSGGTAAVNIGSVSGRRVSVGANSQSVHVGGSINNESAGRGSRAEVNIGSITDSTP